MIKLSKKQLKNEAIYNEAYYFTGNVYSYENIIYYIDKILFYKTSTNKKNKFLKLKEKNNCIKEAFKNCNKQYYNSLTDIIENIKAIKYDNYKIDKIAYSAGLYGNSGQLHKITLYYKNNIVGIYYLYY